MLLPPCAVAKPTGSVSCFTPVTTFDDVAWILREAPVNKAGWVLGWNYEPSRMSCSVLQGGPTPGFVTKHGFDCPNLENQTLEPVRRLMDGIRDDVPMLVTTEAGHIAYANTKALTALNICGLPGATPPCYTPIQNVASETNLAATGQLDEDVAFYALGSVMNRLADNYSGGAKEKKIEFLSKQIRAALDLYSALGYTTVQEGAAGTSLMNTYLATALAGELPVRVAFLAYYNPTATPRLTPFNGGPDGFNGAPIESGDIPLNSAARHDANGLHGRANRCNVLK